MPPWWWLASWFGGGTSKPGDSSRGLLIPYSEVTLASSIQGHVFSSPKRSPSQNCQDMKYFRLPRHARYILNSWFCFKGALFKGFGWWKYENLWKGGAPTVTCSGQNFLAKGFWLPVLQGTEPISRYRTRNACRSWSATAWRWPPCRNAHHNFQPRQEVPDPVQTCVCVCVNVLFSKTWAWDAGSFCMQSLLSSEAVGHLGPVIRSVEIPPQQWQEPIKPDQWIILPSFSGKCNKPLRRIPINQSV